MKLLLTDWAAGISAGLAWPHFPGGAAPERQPPLIGSPRMKVRRKSPLSNGGLINCRWNPLVTPPGGSPHRSRSGADPPPGP
ncbi:MAG: hypothetical protein DCF24_07285 [Cyanobium sp.]|nr:MAG: hypothetical protein DCF24_07285 [Cyanobium sp.]